MIRALMIAVSIIFSLPAIAEAKSPSINNNEITICIDAGHGGAGTGYECNY